MKVIRTDHPLYRRAARREAKTWGRPSVAALRGRRPLEHPVVLDYYRELFVDGETQSPWVPWFAAKYGPFSQVLSLGCGSGLFEEQLIHTGAVERLDVVDLAPAAVRSFQRRLEERGTRIPITIDVADLNDVTLAPNKYDLVIARTSLHHVINLEHVLEQVRASLNEAGLFLIHDFVGPSVWQWPESALEAVNRFVAASRQEIPQLRFNEVRRPGKRAVKAVSPFESVRSGDIPAIVRAGFSAEREVLTDRLLFVLLNYGVEMPDWDDPRLIQWLTNAVARERELGTDSGLPPCTLWGVYRRGPRAIPAGSPWTEPEIADRIGVSRIDLTGAALSVIDRLPGRARIVRALAAIRRKTGWY